MDNEGGYMENQNELNIELLSSHPVGLFIMNRTKYVLFWNQLLRDGKEHYALTQTLYEKKNGLLGKYFFNAIDPLSILHTDTYETSSYDEVAEILGITDANWHQKVLTTYGYQSSKTFLNYLYEKGIISNGKDITEEEFYQHNLRMEEIYALYNQIKTRVDEDPDKMLTEGITKILNKRVVKDYSFISFLQ